MVNANATTMNAVVQRAYGDASVFELDTIARPQIGDAEVLIRVRAAGLDRGTWHLMTGRPYLMRILGFGLTAPKQVVPGLDVAGTVVAIGASVTRFAVGDEVFGISRGAYAELAVALEAKLAHKPAGLGFPEAAVLGVSGITALQALRDSAKVTAGQRVLVIGASGGVGSYAVQIAKALGAEVTGICSAAKVDLVRNLGADHVLDYAQCPDDFGAGPAGYDAILDIGGNTPTARLRAALRPTGVLVFVGGEGGGELVGGMIARALGAMALGPFVGQRFTVCATRERYEDLEAVARLVDDGAVRPALDRVFGFDAVPDAMRYLEAGRVRGKVAIVPS